MNGLQRRHTWAASDGFRFLGPPEGSERCLACSEDPLPLAHSSGNSCSADRTAAGQEASLSKTFAGALGRGNSGYTQFAEGLASLEVVRKSHAAPLPWMHENIPTSTPRTRAILGEQLPRGDSSVGG